MASAWLKRVSLVKPFECIKVKKAQLTEKRDISIMSLLGFVDQYLHSCMMSLR